MSNDIKKSGELDSEVQRAYSELESWYHCQSSTCNTEVDEKIKDIAQWSDREVSMVNYLKVWASESIAGYREGKAFAVDKNHWCITKGEEIVAVKSTDDLIKWFVEEDGDFDTWGWVDEHEIDFSRHGLINGEVEKPSDWVRARRLENTDLIAFKFQMFLSQCAR